MGTAATSRSFPGKALHPFGIELAGNVVHESGATGEELVRLIHAHHILVIRGEHLDDDTTGHQLASRLGPLKQWGPMGATVLVRELGQQAGFVFTSAAVPLHFDGALGENVPRYVVLRCRDVAGDRADGGQTFFIDSGGVWDCATAEERRLWSQITISYNIGDRVIEHRLVQRHPVTGAQSLRFVVPTSDVMCRTRCADRSVPDTDAQALLERVAQRCSQPRFRYEHLWRPGDIVLIDNHAVLHGRNAFRSGSPRCLERLHVL